MWRQLKQVAVTYLTRPTWLEWLGYLLALAFYVLFCSFLLDDEGRPLIVLAFALGIGVGVSGLLANQLHWQFHHPRSRLTPGFRRPHLLTGALLMLTFGMAIPLLAMARSTASPWLVLCSLALGAAASQRAYLMNYLWVPLVASMILGERLSDAQLLRPWTDAEGYRKPVLIFGTLLAWGAAFWQAFRITTISEDDSRYTPPVVSDRNAKVSRTFRMARERAEALTSERSGRSSAWTSAWLDRRLRCFPAMRVWQRLDVVFFVRQSPWTALGGLATGVIFVLVLPALANPSADWKWEPARLHALSFFAALATAAAAFSPATTLAGRIPQMTFERLLPISNQGYADALLGICLWWTVRAWLAVQAGVALVVFALPWEGVEATTISGITSYLAISLAGLTYCYGVGTFCSSMQGCFPVLFAAATGALATLALQGYWMSLEPGDSQAVPLMLAGLCVGAGLFFLWRARQLWRHKELASALAGRFA